MSRKLFAALILLLQVATLTLPLSAQERGRAEREREQRREEKERREQAEKESNRFEAGQKPSYEAEDDDPDLPPGSRLSKGEYIRQREEQIALLRGLPYPEQDSRSKAIYQMTREENALRAATGEPDAAPNVNWTPLGPAPIPNGQTTGRVDPVSGRTPIIVVHPTDPNIVYAGTAQGGVYRSLNGGTSWTPLMDSALSLAIGTIAISPSNPSTIYVGTGEAGFSADAFFGVGVYRITNADGANPVLSAALNKDASNADVFTGRAIGKIVVHPTDPNTIFVTTTTGTAGLGSSTGAPAPSLGVYRSTNALSGSPTFAKLSVTPTASTSVLDAVFEPGNPNRLFLTAVSNGATEGGVYFSANALDAAPTFTRTNLVTGAGAELGRAELAINKVGNTVTIYCAHGTASGTVSKASYDATALAGTPTFTTAIANSFCSGQCFYDIALAVDPTDANKVYLGGSAGFPFGRSLNGGASFAISATGLHVDSHTIAVAPSNPNTIYFGSDGGVWKSTDAGLNWVSQNNTTYNATQFESIAVHPTDRNYTLGGTQDNGTEYLFPDGTTWTRTQAGDGGFVAIDSNATSPTNIVAAYHTFFNSTNSQIGFERATTTASNGNPSWGNRFGCGAFTANGINCADAVLFYAPMVLGPGNPNTVYMGTTKLYRSADTGVTMPAVSQQLPLRISAIAISKQDDNVRVVGTTGGSVYATTNGSSTLNDISAGLPARYVGRVAIDPTNANTAYVASGGFGIASHVSKTTNLNAATVTWTAAGSGIPDVPTNGLVIDPANPNQIFAGTDIGVFRTIDGGATWTPFSDGLPRVAVFEIAIQPTSRTLKIATHGRGIWEIPIPAISATPRSRADFDGDGKTDFSVFRSGFWYVQNSTGGFQGVQWGAPTDQILPGDYDNDGKCDYAVYRSNSTTGTNFYVILTNNGSPIYRGANWGVAGDLGRTGDFDGDGTADLAIYRPSTNLYAALPTGGQPIVFQFGQAGDIPITFDYDGDRKTDFAVFRPSNGVWYIRKSTDLSVVSVQFGQSGDRLVPADYDNDNKEDIAVFRNGVWFVLRSGNGQVQSVAWGQSGDVPAPGDFDGDGADDFSVFRNGNWFVLRQAGGTLGTSFGQAGDTPIPTGYVP